MSLFLSLISPDFVGNPQRAVVARAARMLRIGEFQFLQLAFCEWFGEEMSNDIINEQFKSYMLNGQVPYWARHYARRICRLYAAGKLNCWDPYFHRYDIDC